jgi:GNAT superfamily N-acetyltransferase
MTVRIRPAKPEDLAAIKALLREFAAYLNAIDEPEPVLEEEIGRIEQLAFGPEAVCTILIAEADGEVAGHLSYFWGLSMEGVAPALFVGDLFVRDRFRGRGLGRMFMQRAREIARTRGANQVLWTVWRKNAAAQDFYRRLGARSYDEEILTTWPVDPDQENLAEGTKRNGTQMNADKKG